jgi:hypothetical protein
MQAEITFCERLTIEIIEIPKGMFWKIEIGGIFYEELRISDY